MTQRKGFLAYAAGVASITVIGAAASAPGFAAQPAVSESVVYAFDGSSGSGARPWAPLIWGQDGKLYGTAPLTGEITFNGQTFLAGGGTVFSVDGGGVATAIHDFDAANTQCEGWTPGTGALLQTHDGSLYGTTLGGGSAPAQAGTVYRVGTDGSVITLHSFDGNDGAYLWGGLVDGQDGYLYGTTSGTYGVTGGDAVNGSVFRIDAAGDFTVLYSFTGAADSAHPVSLIRGSDGNFYGVTTGDATTGDFGSIFEITPEGALTTLYKFPDGSDGIPATLIQGRDGNFYGTRTPPVSIGVGGASMQCNPSPPTRGQQPPFGSNASAASLLRSASDVNGGTVFRLTPRGRLITLHRFNGSDGFGPQGGLVQGRDGAFYGTTVSGGANDEGTVFRIRRSGRFTSLYSFAGGSDGANPAAALLQAPTGNVFYGTTFRGGAEGLGTVYKIRAGYF